MNASEIGQAGKLDEAIAESKERVKKKPTDADARMSLAQLLCLSGDLEKADSHLDAIGMQDPPSAIIVSLFRQLIHGEQWRQQFFAEGRVPELLSEPNEIIRLLIEASICLREGKPTEAAELIERTESLRPTPTGTRDDKPFDDFRDLDDLLGPVVEVLTSTGKYFWIPADRIESIEFHPPETLFDLVWRRAHMSVLSGPDGEVFLPVLYAGASKESDAALRVGRATDWRGAEGEPIRGVGQRMFLIGDEDCSIMDLTTLEFNVESDGAADRETDAK